MKVLSALAAFVLCIGCGVAQAIPITYDFSVTATSGPLNGTSANGSLSFDDVTVPAGASILGTNLLTFLDFTWDSIAYTAATTTSAGIYRAATGEVTHILFGTNCYSGGCTTFGATKSWHLGMFGVTPIFAYSTGVGATPSEGATITFTLRQASVPEPASMGLLALAFAALGLSRRRKHS